MSTHKQKLVASRITDNHGNISKTMREVGYAANTAKKPSNLTNSKGWGELMSEHLPDKILAEALRKIIDNSKESISIRGLDLAFKLKGYYKNEAPEVRNSIEDFSDEELWGIVTDGLKVDKGGSIVPKQSS